MSGFGFRRWGPCLWCGVVRILHPGLCLECAELGADLCINLLPLTPKEEAAVKLWWERRQAKRLAGGASTGEISGTVKPGSGEPEDALHQGPATSPATP